MQIVDQLALDVDDKEEKDKTGNKYLTSAFSAEVVHRADELYRFIYPRLNAALAMNAMRIRDLNRFELYRFTSQNMDPINKSLPWALKDDWRACGMSARRTWGT